MRNLIFILALASLVISCSPSKTLSSGMKTPVEMNAETVRDGSSFAQAIYITQKNERDGVDAEYAWIRSTYPGYRLKSQSLTFKGKKPYDIIYIVTASGQEKSIYFDISNFYGKF